MNFLPFKVPGHWITLLTHRAGTAQASFMAPHISRAWLQYVTASKHKRVVNSLNPLSLWQLCWDTQSLLGCFLWCGCSFPRELLHTSPPLWTSGRFCLLPIPAGEYRDGSTRAPLNTRTAVVPDLYAGPTSGGEGPCSLHTCARERPTLAQREGWAMVQFTKFKYETNTNHKWIFNHSSSPSFTH